MSLHQCSTIFSASRFICTLGCMNDEKTRVSRKKIEIPPQLPRVDFDVWRKNFEQSLRKRINANAQKAYKLWVDSVTSYYAFIGARELTERPQLLQHLYDTTCPLAASTTIEQKRNTGIAKSLNSLLPQIESTARDIKKSGEEVPAVDGVLTVNLTDVLKCLESTAHSISGTLMFLNHKYVRDADVLGQCLGFLYDLNSKKIPEAEAFALATLVMKAHGYRDKDLLVLSEAHRRDGTVRRRMSAYYQRIFKTLEAALEHRAKKP
jgi:hypothetical protein